ncbi:thioesterase-like superfamily-domain-containing protein [Clohesyomyces aquaticus]|uniref:Thioesterase-like superfamily-domain-containing protein n=1 Tax=Clohesyomyces aquaticus TaxID=1231657 RepID=A0A1Y1ZMG1_9PLEO|nr:thioesterase-like superfamily-domain-containing protein [Clohesyomyces aquaticus]
MTSWEQATAVEKLDSRTYACNLFDDWCIGTVPNGGYVTGCILQVVSMHFNTSLAKQNQPHTIALHVEFLRRTQAGPATFRVDDVKLGRQASIVHVHMSQDGREEVIAYVTNSNMDAEEGVSFETEYSLRPPPPPVDLKKLEEDKDENWYRQGKMPFSTFRKASTRVQWHFPRSGQALKSLADEWLCFTDGSNFTNTSIGFVADMFPQIIEDFRDEKQGPFWYPTLLLNLDIKKVLPPEGVKWLAIRVQMKKIKNGRMDLEVHVHDAEGDLVCLSHHIGFVLDAARNMSARSKSDSKM